MLIMRKVFTFAALASLLVLVSCKDEEPTTRDWNNVNSSTLKLTVGQSVADIERELGSAGFELLSEDEYEGEYEDYTTYSYAKGEFIRDDYSREYILDESEDYEMISLSAYGRSEAISEVSYRRTFDRNIDRATLEAQLDNVNLAGGGVLSENSAIEDEIKATIKTYTSFDDIKAETLNLYDTYDSKDPFTSSIITLTNSTGAQIIFTYQHGAEVSWYDDNYTPETRNADIIDITVNN